MDRDGPDDGNINKISSVLKKLQIFDIAKGLFYRLSLWSKKEGNRFRWRIHARFPNLVSSPTANPSDRPSRDKADNQSTRVSTGENLTLGCIWVAELYGPSEIEALYSGLRKFGWDKAEVGLSGFDPISWIKNQRMYGYGGHFNVGYVYRPGTTSWHPQRYFSPVPDKFSHLIVRIYQITKSVTCVSVGFVLNNKHAKCYESEINQDRQGFNKRQSGQRGYSVFDVIHIKKEKLQKTREKYRDQATKWFETCLPGLFSRDSDGRRFPTSELIFTNGQITFPRIEEHQSCPKWIRFLDLDFARELWSSDQYPGLKFSLNQLEGDLRFHIIATVKRDDAKQIKRGTADTSTDSGLIFCLGEAFNEVLVHYACIALLSEIRRDLVEYRESISLSRGGRAKLLKVLFKLEKFFAESIGVRAAAQELLAASRDTFHFVELQGSGFTYKDNYGAIAKTHDIADSFRSQTAFLAEEVIADESATRELFEQLSTIMSTRENVIAQAKMEKLTWITIAFAFISVVMAYLALK